MRMSRPAKRTNSPEATINKPIVKNVWNGRQLPFPLLLDNSFRTCESFGIDGFGKMLIDPQGRLVQGDEKTLAEKLKDTAQRDRKQ